jgi:ATP-binding cassette subfamily B protein
MKDKIIATNIKGLKLLTQWRKTFIPLLILNGLFANLAPFVTIYMSAEIINELAGARNTQRLLYLVLFTITADLIIVIISNILQRFMKSEKTTLENAEKRMFTEFGFKMDYEHLENPEIRQNRRKIDESKCINLFGIWALVHSFQQIIAGVIEIILAIVFTSSLFILIFRQASDMTGAVLYPASIVSLVALSIFISLKNAKKLTKLGDDLSNTNLEHNRIDDGFWQNYKAMQDIRIYLER